MRYLTIYIFENEKHRSDYIWSLKSHKIASVRPIILGIDVLNINFKALKQEIDKNCDWRPRGKCPLCFWNSAGLVVSGFDNSNETYHKCPHFIYNLDSIEFPQNGYKEKRESVKRTRDQFSHIIVDWDNWITHLKKESEKNESNMSILQ